MAFIFPVKVSVTERTFVIGIQDILTTLSTYRSDMYYMFLDVKKKKLVKCRENLLGGQGEFTGGSSFYWKLLFSLSLIYDRLFVIFDRFSNTSCKL